MPAETQTEIVRLEDWKLPHKIEVEELERLLESWENPDSRASIANAPNEPAILRVDERYEDQSNPNGIRDES